MKKAGLFFLCLCFLSSCENDENEDKVKVVDKDGSVETKISVSHLSDSTDLMKTENTYWIKGKAVKSTVFTDTIPGLGMISVQGTIPSATGDEDDEKDTTVRVKKNYQLFITVK